MSDIPSYLLKNDSSPADRKDLKSPGYSFVERTLIRSAGVMKSMYLQSENSSGSNPVRKLHSDSKLISLIFLVTSVSFVRNPVSLIIVSVFIFILYLTSGLNVILMYRRILFLSFLFGFIVVLPATLNIFTPGRIILPLITFNGPASIAGYKIPGVIGLTDAGIKILVIIFFRIVDSVSFALFIVSTTPFADFIKSLRLLRVPGTFLMIISLAYKYIFILSRTIEDTYLAVRSRLAGRIRNKSVRNLVGGRIFYIFRKSAQIHQGTYHAMVSRGYTGSVSLASRKRYTGNDLVFLAIISVLCVLIILL